jgi:T-complex protein 1 subunit epsilon
LIKIAMSSLSSKVVSKYKRHLSEIAVEAVLSVCDQKRKDVNFELIKIVQKPGKSIEETTIIKGLVIDKDFSHPQMEKTIKNAKVAILTCPFEAPKPKTKYNININNQKDYKDLYNKE